MAQMRRVLVNSNPIEAKYIEDGVAVVDVRPVSWESRLEYVPEEPTYEWGPVEFKTEDVGEPYMKPVYNNDGGLFRTPTIAAMVMHQPKQHTETRRLFKRWVDREQGPMVEWVDTETIVRYT